MEFYSNNQLPKNNIYTSNSTYKYNITYPISNTFKQSTYTGTNIQKNYTQSYQNYSSDIKTTKGFYNTSNTNYNASYGYNNINSNTLTNYDNYFQSKNYQSKTQKNTGNNIYQPDYVNNPPNMKVLPTKYLPTKILKEGESYDGFIDFAVVIPLKEKNESQNNFISTKTESGINEYYQSTPEITYSNQQYDFANYETKIDTKNYNYELNNETNINIDNNINTINTMDNNDVNINDANIYSDNNIIENELVNLPQENYTINTIEEINENNYSSNNNQPINSPEIYQEQENIHSYTHKSPEFNYKANYFLSPVQSPLEKYETQSYNGDTNFDINEMFRLIEENERYKKQLQELDKYKAEAAQVKELREQVEQLSPLREKVVEMDLLKDQLKELNQLREKVNQLEALKSKIEQMEYNNQNKKLQSSVQNQDNAKIKETQIKTEKQILEKIENTEKNIEPEQEPEEEEIVDPNSEPKEEEQEIENRDSNIEHEEEQENPEIENRDSNIEHEEEQEQEEHPENEIEDLNNEQKEEEEYEQENRDSNIEHENEEEQEEHQEIENRDPNIELNKETKEIENRDSNIELEEINQPSYVRGDIIHNMDELEMIIRKINKNNSKITLNLLYKASADSDRAKAFHKKCDKAKSTLVLIETGKGKRFGGYTSVDWKGKCIEKNDENAFVFSLDKMKIYDIIPGEKAIGCYPKFGPIFLGCQIRIYDHAFKNGGTTWEKGLNYNTDEDFVLTGGERIFNVKDIEVYEVIIQ